MGIQKCKNCGTKFKYKDLLKPLWGFPDPLICRNCGTPHELKQLSSFAVIVLTVAQGFLWAV